jgi:hypothetical protein
MKLYAVMDTKGDGRLVGVWDSKRIANKIIKHYPAYYKLHTVQLNKINKDVFAWTGNAEQKKFLQELSED